MCPAHAGRVAKAFEGLLEVLGVGRAEV
ncbi:MAG: hypothetical protein JWQ20_2780, partial [Conexibacter sp.]|nr:hypothetical protein [Conexibacter sp.]